MSWQNKPIKLSNVTHGGEGTLGHVCFYYLILTVLAILIWYQNNYFIVALYRDTSGEKWLVTSKSTLSQIYSWAETCS